MRVLSLSGGGIRGIIEIMLLKKIVENSEVKFEKLFDYVIGTSIGGILGAALTVKGEDGSAKYSPEEVFNMMLQNAESIFPNDSGNVSFGNFWGSKYSREGIDQFLFDKLGDKTFLDTVIPFTTLSYSMEFGHPRTWSTCKAQKDSDNYNYYLRDGAGATSAAPTYFPIKYTQHNGKDMYDVDGGIFANTPIHIGMSEIHECDGEKYTDLNDAIIISLGTGIFPHDSHDPTISDLSKVRWLYHGLVDKIMSSAESTDVITASKLYRLVRIDPKLDKNFQPMDKTDKQHLEDFQVAVNKYIEENSVMLQKIADCLTSENHSSKASSSDSHPCNYIISESNKQPHLDFKYSELDGEQPPHDEL